MAARIVCAILFMLPCCGAIGSGTNFRGAAAQIDFRGNATRQVLLEELAGKGHRLSDVEDELRDLFTAMPKNAFGKLGHQTVRRALNRFFVARHGWYFRDLDANAASTASGAQPANQMANQAGVLSVNMTVPDYLEETLDEISGARGADLHDLAAMAAALMDLVDKDVRAHLQIAYDAERLPTAGGLAFEDAKKVIDTYFMAFALEYNFTTFSSMDLKFTKQAFHKKYEDGDAAFAWLEEVSQRHIPASASRNFTFDELANLCMDISKEYTSKINERDCKGLRSTLNGMEGRKPGRVRLSTFYNMSLHTHWLFIDKVENLRAMGVLDESDPSVPMVIIPNYAMALPNCLKSSPLFSFCCTNICEDLLASLEKSVSGPTASAAQITKVVESTMDGKLTPTLRSRLDELSVRHDGEVPLHGRLFAQWMHHVYPLQCPYPQEVGVYNQSAIDMYLKSGGESASTEEMKEHVDSDSCPIDADGKVGCDGESTELPWSTAEDLMEYHAQRPKKLSVVLKLLSVVYVLAGLLQASKKQDFVRSMCLAFPGVAYWLGLLDDRIFFVSALCSCAVMFGQAFNARRYGKFGALPTHKTV